MSKYVLEAEDDDWNNFAVVHRVDGETKVEVGWIGGEPEDNCYYRDYAWIVPALNEAYELGYAEGRKQ